jgi:hypothetical protein
MELDLAATIHKPYDHKYKVLLFSEIHSYTKIIISNDVMKLSEIALWCSENLHSNWSDELCGINSRVYYFKCPDDATLFALKWS